MPSCANFGSPWTRVVLLLLALATFAGCGVTLQQGLPPSFAADTPPPELALAYEKMAREGEANWVLNLQSIAVGAMRYGYPQIARRALDEAILQIEIVYGDSAQARQARGLFYAEGSKIFKGDPYERSMTYILRAVLYMQDGEWDNARACLRSAAVMDSFSEDEQYSGDWVIVDFLTAACETRLGRPFYAKEAMERARKSYEKLAATYPNLSDRESFGTGRAMAPLPLSLWAELQPWNEISNVLVVAGDGRGPRKMGAGAYNELLSYTPGGGVSEAVVVAVDEQEIGQAQPVDSVYYQAVTRGGREVDAMLGRQAVFKQATSDVGNAAIVGGTALGWYGLTHDDDKAAYAGGAVVAAGILSALISTMTRPEADTRTWMSLPDQLDVFQARLHAGERTIRVLWENPAGVGYGRGASAEATIHVPRVGNRPCRRFGVPSAGTFFVTIPLRDTTTTATMESALPPAGEPAPLEVEQE